MKAKMFKAGDRVRYASAFLRNTGQYTGEVPQMRGTVDSIKPMGTANALVKVLWDGETETRGVLSSNLEKSNR